MSSEYLLVKLSCNYADEFDIDSIEVWTKEEYDKAVAEINEYLSEGNSINVCFGSNEDVDFSGDITDYLEVEKISKKDYDVLEKHVGSHGMITLSEVWQKAGENKKSNIENKLTEELFLKLVESNPEIFTKPLSYGEANKLTNTLVEGIVVKGIVVNLSHMSDMIQAEYYVRDLIANHKEEFSGRLDSYYDCANYLENKYNISVRMICGEIMKRFAKLTGIELESDD